MAKLYLEDISMEYEIPEEIVKKYSINSGMLSPFTKSKIIAVEEENTAKEH